MGSQGDWALNRSFLDSRETVPADLLRSHDAELVYKINGCVIETRKTEATLRSIYISMT